MRQSCLYDCIIFLNAWSIHVEWLSFLFPQPMEHGKGSGNKNFGKESTTSLFGSPNTVLCCEYRGTGINSNKLIGGVLAFVFWCHNLALLSLSIRSCWKVGSLVVYHSELVGLNIQEGEVREVGGRAICRSLKPLFLIVKVFFDSLVWLGQ